ncbi:MAG TPA: PAS domain-containing sensor histidine kinase [Gemmatimonadaceae bacterium]|nr:PAS domain-containing sensor histidine kinase [Gemmatimonadaceae bacterium]
MPAPFPPASKHSTDARLPDAARALDALVDGIVAVCSDWRILLANQAGERLLARAPAAVPATGEPASLWEAIPALAAGQSADCLRATMADGRTRSFVIRLPGSSDSARTEVRVTAMAGGGGGICLQFREPVVPAALTHPAPDPLAERTAVRDLARALAEEEDVDALLHLICEHATVQCNAAGATIGQLQDDHVEVVAGAGLGCEAIGLRLALHGSLTEQAFLARATVRVRDYMAQYPALAAMRPGFAVGPAFMVPLIAQAQVLGVLMVVRAPGAAPFSVTEEDRAQVIADHAALAIWKSQLLERAQDANRAKSTFLATMSHELRTPLTALTGYEELLVDEVFGPLTEPQIAAVERMHTSTELLALIIEEILTFSRLEAGEERAHLEATNAQDIVRDAISVLEPLALAKSLDLIVVEPDAPLELVTDADMLRRILVNLGANAVKFTAHGSVEMAVFQHHDAVRIAVRDTGIGIQPADMPRLFHPFTQLDSGFTRRYRGTGLGLFISQRLAALLGGRIEVQSVVGEGSVFTVVLPG